MSDNKLFDSYNAGYAQQLYEEYRRNPSSVGEEWRREFAADGAEAALIPVEDGAVAAAPSGEQLRAAVAASELIDAWRLHGHTAARLDPLGGEPEPHPTLDRAFYGLSAGQLERLPASLFGLGDGGAATMADALDRLRRIYTGPVGYEFEHLEDPERREWLRQRIESGTLREPLGADARRGLLERLTEVESLEMFIHRSYLGKKRFSIEGNDMLVPMLDEAIERAAASGAGEVVLGMAHRGRLNVLAHIIGRSYERIIAEFEGKQVQQGTGDVKYHLGANGTYATASGGEVEVTLAPNPSHLEFVDPVVEGITRAKQEDRSGTELGQDPDAVLPVLMHGDAAFVGEGVAAETLNLSGLDPYRTGGTLHIIVNNQLGFTTPPEQGRSMRYASDMARGYGLPIIHVNADAPAECLAATRLALAYRERFHDDVLIDLVGYRRYGHNEGDEPAYTQPRMYAEIDEHPTVRTQWAETLAAEGVVSEDEAEEGWDAAYDGLTEAQDEVREQSDGSSEAPPPAEPATLEPAVETTVSEELLRAIDGELHEWPEDFHVQDKLGRQLKGRSERIPEEGGPIDWAHAESLCFGTLLAEGRAVRLSGQDTRRGTFSQRHLVLHDTETGAEYSPIRHLEEAEAPFEVYNSPLSEVSTLGFEYGYSTQAEDALVLWEAQFGDFSNVAQVITDQFIASGRVKWGQTSRLVLLLPHAYEGQGPEHSSARIERFLQLAAEDNLRIANCTTPAQYFHLLRRQARLEERRPLVVFTPKSLLRNPRATSTLDELSGGRFRMVLGDEGTSERAGEITRLVLCSGKVYYDLIGSDAREQAGETAVARIEQLYPFPTEGLEEVLERYPALEEVVWAQEEPENMGAWRFMEPRLRELLGDEIQLGYVGRPERASPAEGYASAHKHEQQRIVRDAFTAPAEPPERVRSVEKGEEQTPAA